MSREAGIHNPFESWTDRDLVRSLLEADRGLSQWEVDFAESLAGPVIDRGRSMTPRQREKAKQIVSRLIDQEIIE